MKFTITFKTPDIDDQLTLAIEDEANSDTSAEELDKMTEVFEKFVRYNENVEIEFDTDNMSAKVLPRI